MSALDEVGNALEDVGDLAHHPEALLHESEELLVLLWGGALLVGGDVVVELKRLLVALDGDGVLLAAVPPVRNPHP